MQTERGFRFGLTLLVLSALAAAARADEIVIQRDGRRSQGSLTGCGEDGCTLNGARVPRSDIAWIGFDSTGQPPISGSAESDEIHLKDGRILRESVGRISRGAIGLEGDASIDRDDVAWVRFAGAAPAEDARAQPVDSIRLRSGAERTVTLRGCAAGRCYLGDGSSIVRDEIAVIGLGRKTAESLPAGAKDDVVRLADGTSWTGSVFGISPVDVVAASGQYPREQVAQVLLASEPTPEEPIPMPGAPSAGSKQPSSPATGPAPGSAVAPPPAGPGSGRKSPVVELRPGSWETVANGALWSGMAFGTYRREWGGNEPGFHHHTMRLDIRLRETVRQDWFLPGESRPAFTQIFLRNDRSTMSNSYSGRSCTGQASKTFTDERDSSWAYVKRTDRDVAPPPDFPPNLPPSGAAEFRFHLFGGWNACPRAGPSFVYWGLAGEPFEIGGYGAPFKERWTPPLSDGGTRFHGHFRHSMPMDQGTVVWDVRWDICRQGNQSCVPALPAKMDCQGPEQQQGHRDVCQAELAKLSAELEVEQREFDRLWKEANARTGDLAQAFVECKAYDVVKKILEKLLAAQAKELGEAGKAVEHLRKVTEAAAKGDLKSLLLPDQANAMLDALADFKEFAEMLTTERVALVTGKLESCSGKVRVPTYLEAEKALQFMTAAADLHRSRIAPKMNDIRAKAIECGHLAYVAYRACLQTARCRGQKPNCGPDPSLLQ